MATENLSGRELSIKVRQKHLVYERSQLGGVLTVLGAVRIERLEQHVGRTLHQLIGAARIDLRGQCLV